MNELSDVLAGATADIAPGYFRLNIHGGPVPIYRERVYCYELYHQMRLRWPKECAFVLNGEVDKRNHPKLMERGVRGLKPDLLIHRPGDMGGNHTIMEVKSADAAWDGCGKDLETLAIFRTKADYERAIYLVYGDDISDGLIERIVAADSKMDLRAPTELWLHHRPGRPAEFVRRLGEMEEASADSR